MARASYKPGRAAFVVHPDVTALSRFQTTLAAAGFTAIIARDLPTALLAMTHHYFEIAIISSRIAEEGDGWALGGVVRQAFPSAHIVVLTPEPSVPTYQAAINNGISEIFDKSISPEEIANAVLARVLPSTGSREKRPRAQ